uniref:Harmonin-like n=1 Tax=Saccoglossus kowalevskii TaxID=10224 RepID=A0ABM0MGM6_SACKO|nr:PREDICTED: harmonin-like [Saccoglossus kowalevskii]
MVLKSSKQLTIHLKEGAAAESGFDIYAKPQRSVRPQRDQQEQEELMKLRQLALEREREKQQRLDIERAEAEKLQKEELLKHQRLEVEHPPQQKQEKTNIENEERWRRVSRTSVDTDKESEMIAQELLEVSLHQEQIEHQKSLSLQDQWNAEREEIERQMEIESKRTVLPQETDAQNFTSTMKVHLTSESYAKNRQTRDDTDSQFNARKLFTDREIGGREIRVLKIKKDGPLEILIEGGLDSPIGKCVVSEVYEGGAAWRHGGLFKGDQIMMVDGKKTADAKLAEAEEILKDAMKNTDGTGTLELVIALAPPKNYEDEITFF